MFVFLPLFYCTSYSFWIEPKYHTWLDDECIPKYFFSAGGLLVYAGTIRPVASVSYIMKLAILLLFFAPKELYIVCLLSLSIWVYIMKVIPEARSAQ